MTPHTTHAADLIDLGCPRCLAQWEVIRATQTMPTSASVTAVWAVYADPLHVPEDPPKEARRMPEIAFLAATSLALAIVAGVLIYRDRRGGR